MYYKQKCKVVSLNLAHPVEDGRRAACLEGSHNKLCARTTKGCIERVVLCVGCGAKSAKDDSTFATTSGETGVR